MAEERKTKRRVEVIVGFDSDMQLYESSACYEGPAPREPIEDSWITTDDPYLLRAELSKLFVFKVQKVKSLDL